MVGPSTSITPGQWFRRLVLIGIAWQCVPSAWLMWDAWDSPSTQTIVLRVVVFLLVPFIAGVIHRSWQIWLTCLVLPIFAIGVMFTIFMVIMPVGHW